MAAVLASGAQRRRVVGGHPRTGNRGRTTNHDRRSPSAVDHRWAVPGLYLRRCGRSGTRPPRTESCHGRGTGSRAKRPLSDTTTRTWSSPRPGGVGRGVRPTVSPVRATDAPRGRPVDPYLSGDYGSANTGFELDMIPPLVRRCPECGHTTWSGRFPVVAVVDERSLVECPSCSHRFGPVDNPMLK